jgi:hypothetical protein
MGCAHVIFIGVSREIGREAAKSVVGDVEAKVEDMLGFSSAPIIDVASFVVQGHKSLFFHFVRRRSSSV